MTEPLGALAGWMHVGCIPVVALGYTPAGAPQLLIVTAPTMLVDVEVQDARVAVIVSVVVMLTTWGSMVWTTVTVAAGRV